MSRSMLRFSLAAIAAIISLTLLTVPSAFGRTDRESSCVRPAEPAAPSERVVFDLARGVMGGMGAARCGAP